MRTIFVLTVLTAAALAGGADDAKKLLEHGKISEARKACEALVAKDKTNVDAWLVLADALVGDKEEEEAWTQLEAAIEAVPKDDRLRLKLGDVFVKLAVKEQKGRNDATTIENYYADAKRLYAEAHEIKKSAAALYGKALVHYSLGKAGSKDVARKLLGEALMLDAKHGPSHALQADLLYYDGSREKDVGKRKAMFASAQQKYSVAAKCYDGDARMFVRWGHACYGQGDNAAARAAYLEGIKRHPDSDIPLSGLRLLANQGDKSGYWTRLTVMLEDAAKVSPKSIPTLVNLGFAHMKTQRWEDSLAAFKKGRALDPKNATFPYYEGYVYESMNDKKKALDKYEEALQLNSSYQQPIYRFQGIILNNYARNIESAEKLFERLLKLAPKNADIRNNYALLLRNWSEANGATRSSAGPLVVKRIRRSGAIYEQAAALLPNSAQVQSDTGLLFEFYPPNFDPEKAKKYFIKSLEISEFVYRDAFDGLTRLCRRTKDWETLSDYAEGVIGAMERGKNPVAPVGGGAPRELPNQRQGMLARAKAAYDLAQRGLKKKTG